MQNNQIELRQQSLASVLIGLPRTPRLALGVIVIAFFVRYAILVPITLTGRWVNALFDPFELSIVCGLLVTHSLVCYKTKRDKLVTLIFALVSTLIPLLPMLYFRGFMNTFVDNWPNVVYPTLLFGLNRSLFLLYTKAVNL